MLVYEFMNYVAALAYLPNYVSNPHSHVRSLELNTLSTIYRILNRSPPSPYDLQFDYLDNHSLPGPYGV